MHLRRKNRNRIIFVVIVLFIIVYWHGTVNAAKAKGLNCSYHIVYAFCSGKGKVQLPSFWDVMKAGIKF